MLQTNQRQSVHKNNVHTYRWPVGWRGAAGSNEETNCGTSRPKSYLRINKVETQAIGCDGPDHFEGLCPLRLTTQARGERKLRDNIYHIVSIYILTKDLALNNLGCNNRQLQGHSSSVNEFPGTTSSIKLIYYLTYEMH